MAPHYSSKAEARAAYEAQQSGSFEDRREIFAFDTGDGHWSVRVGDGLDSVPDELKSNYQKSFYRVYGTGEGVIFRVMTEDGDGYPVRAGETIDDVPRHLHKSYVTAWNAYQKRVLGV